MEVTTIIQLQSLSYMIFFSILFLLIYNLLCQCEVRDIEKKRKLWRRVLKALRIADRRTLRVHDHLIDNLDQCSICNEIFELGNDVVTLPCSHEFHISCIKNQLLEKRTCRICNNDILRILELKAENPINRDGNGEGVDMYNEEEEDLILESKLFPIINSPGFWDNEKFLFTSKLDIILFLLSIGILICIFLIFFGSDVLL